mgnify:CR=1 FL=1
MGESQELSQELRKGSRADTIALDEAGKEVVEVVKVDRRGIGEDGIATSIASILHNGPKQKGTLGGALVEQEEVQQGGVGRFKLEEVG